MKTVKELTEDLAGTKALMKQQKLDALLKIRGGVNEIEVAAMRDPSFAISELRAARALLGEIDASISRSQSAIKRFGP